MSGVQIQIKVSLAQSEIQLAITIIYHSLKKKIHYPLKYFTSLGLPG